MKNDKIPVLTIEETCKNSEIDSFKIASFNEITCTATEFEENHRHEFFEIIWLKNGIGNHFIDFHDHSYNGSVMFILSPGQIHQIHQLIPSEGYVMKFLPSVFANEKEFLDFILDTCMYDNQLTCPVIKIPAHLEPTLEDICGHLVKEFRHPETNAGYIISAYLRILITHINRIKQNAGSYEVQVSDPQYALFRSFKIAVEKSYKREHSVNGYAKMLDTNPRLLNTVSRKYSGKSAGEIIQDRILLEAQRSLYHETRSIKEICYELGFEDPAYFTRFFKRHTGVAPQSFKANRTLVLS